MNKKNEEMPTIMELIKTVNKNKDKFSPSMCSGDSRTILKYTDKPVAAYARSPFVFIAIVETERTVIATVYSKLHPFKTWSQSGLSIITLSEAIEEIENNKDYCERRVDEEALGKAITKERAAYPLLGKMSLKQTYHSPRPQSWNEPTIINYELRQYKNGNYFFISHSSWGHARKPLGEVFDKYLKARHQIPAKEYDYSYEITSIEIPANDLVEMEKQYLITQI